MRGPRRTAAVLAALLLALGAPALAKDDAKEDPARLAARNAGLAQELELAKGDDFYLVLDLAGPVLRLMYKGAVLRELQVTSLGLKVPEIAFVDRGDRAIAGRIWEGGRLDPPRHRERTVLDPSQLKEGDDPSAIIPPTPEEAYPAPHRYLIRYDGGLALEFTTGEAAGTGGGVFSSIADLVRDAKAALLPSDGDRLRLEIGLAPEDAANLYRGVPQSTRLVILTP